jgi:hypothetical protein
MGLLRTFAKGLEKQKSETRSLVSLARSRGYQVLMYGAAPRSCLLASVCQIGEMIDFVVDDRQDIHRRLMPGTQCFVQPLKEVVRETGDRLLCLLGVGAENEFKVRARVEESVKARLAFVSLFPPRDTLASLAEARQRIAADRKG